MISKASIKRIAGKGNFKVNSKAVEHIAELAEYQVEDIGVRSVGAAKHRLANVVKYKDVEFIVKVAAPRKSAATDKENGIISAVVFETKVENGRVIPVLFESSEISKNALGKSVKSLTNFKIGNDAKIALVQTTEHYITEILKKSDLLRISASRTFIQDKDIDAALGIVVPEVA